MAQFLSADKKEVHPRSTEYGSWVVQSTWFGEVNDLSIILPASHIAHIGPLLKNILILKTLTAGVWGTRVDESTISNSGECA